MSETPTRITRVGTVVLPVDDQDAALDFFVNTLGFETGWTPSSRPDSGGSRWLRPAPRRRSRSWRVMVRRHRDQLRDRRRRQRSRRVAIGGRGCRRELIQMGEGVPPMFTFRDASGNGFRVVERADQGRSRSAPIACAIVAASSAGTSNNPRRNG